MRSVPSPELSSSGPSWSSARNGPRTRPDEERPTKHRTFAVFGRPLTISGHLLRTRIRYMRNFDLDNAIRDDELDVNDRLHPEAFYFVLRQSRRDDVHEAQRRLLSRASGACPGTRLPQDVRAIDPARRSPPGRAGPNT